VVLIQTGKELIAGLFELVNGFVIVPVQHGFLEELPKSLDQVENRRIRREKKLFDFGVFQVVLHWLGTVITGVVANDINPRGIGILCFDWLKQLDRQLTINDVVTTNNGIEVAAIDDSIDVERLPTRIAANFVDLPTLDPIAR
jgi:hypothetical protein